MERNMVKAASFCLVLLVALVTAANAQVAQPSPQPVMPPIMPRVVEEPLRVTGKTGMYCAGYIRYQKIPRSPEIVGAEQEQEQRIFVEGDVVYINAGAQEGVKMGQHYQVIRPRGDVKGVYRQKKGYLGTYVQEVGQLEVFKVNEHTSAAQVTLSCENFLFGDLLMPVPYREAPLEKAQMGVDQYADPSGKQIGRLMMAKNYREMLSRSDIVYIDLGSEDNVKAGDQLTIFRPLGTGNLKGVDNEESARGRSDGFQSDTYRGGGFGNQATRAKDSTAWLDTEGRYRYKPITTREVKRHRPEMPRKIVGEMVILDVQTRTATAIITRSVAEVHTGDWVEIQ